MGKLELEERLELFKELHNMGNGNMPINKIEVYSGVKTENYHLPDIFIGRDSSPEAFIQYENNRSKPAWFVEIWINGLCIWRKSKCNATNENLQQYEQELIDETLLEIFFYGINASWRQIIERKN